VLLQHVKPPTQLDLFQGTSYMGASLGTRFLLANSAVENMQ